MRSLATARESAFRSGRQVLANAPLVAGAATWKKAAPLANRSVGVRIKHVSYFKGAVMRAFATRALAIGVHESAGSLAK